LSGGNTGERSAFGEELNQMNNRFRKISVGISLVTLALGFSLIGLLSVIHHPLAGESLKISATISALGGVAGLAIGSIFSVSGVVYWRSLVSSQKSGSFVQV
jgi:hypothetical protein